MALAADLSEKARTAGAGKCPNMGLGSFGNSRFRGRGWGPAAGRRGGTCSSPAPARCRFYSIVKDLGRGERLAADAENVVAAAATGRVARFLSEKRTPLI